MKRVLILVEGQSELQFVNDIVRPHFEPQNIYIMPTMATTKRLKKGADFKGGIVSYGKFRFDILQLLKDTNASLVTTLIDYYHLPSDFPKVQTDGTWQQRVLAIEEGLIDDIHDRRFQPFIMVQELEALMFADPIKIISAFPEDDKTEEIVSIRKHFDSLEDINDDLPPSKRIRSIYPSYKKTFHSYFVLSEIGIAKLRESSLRFDQWLHRIADFPQN